MAVDFVREASSSQVPTGQVTVGWWSDWWLGFEFEPLVEGTWEENPSLTTKPQIQATI